MAANRKRRTGKPANRRVKSRAKTTQRRGVMNALETEYAKHLDGLKAGGTVHAWRYEAVTLRLTHPPKGGMKQATYTPDFLVLFSDGATEIHETKGHRFETGVLRLKTAAELFDWWTFRLVERERNGDWKITEV